MLIDGNGVQMRRCRKMTQGPAVAAIVAVSVADRQGISLLEAVPIAITDAVGSLLQVHSQFFTPDAITNPLPMLSPIAPIPSPINLQLLQG